MNDIVQVEVARPLAQADTDEQLIALWLHGRPNTTREAYEGDAKRFRTFVNRTMHEVRLVDLQQYADSLSGLSDAAQSRKLSVVKSLFGFAHKIGYLQFDVARVLRLPKVHGRVTERILTERQVMKLVSEGEPGESRRELRDRTVINLLFFSGCRASELCALSWKDVLERSNPEAPIQIEVTGKGNRRRSIVLPPNCATDLLQLRPADPHPDDPVFVSQKGGALQRNQVRLIVKAAAKKAGLQKNCFPHMLRHTHATLALSRGGNDILPILQKTLGHTSLGMTGNYISVLPTKSSSLVLPR